MRTADSSGIQFVALDSSDSCQTDTARVSVIDPPSSPADSAVNLITAHFCSAGSPAATTAYLLLDLIGGSRGRLKVVALDPRDPDSSRVIESNEVTYNGGVDGEYAPVVLGASSIHQSLRLEVAVVGSGLGGTRSLGLVASDSSWSLPLTITDRSDRAVKAFASVAALLPACSVNIGSEDGIMLSGTLTADEEPTPLDPESCQAEFFEELLTPPPGHGYAIQPKDFAFTRGFVDQSSSRFALHVASRLSPEQLEVVRDLFRGGIG